MDARTLKEKYLSFFKSKGHAIIPSASIIPDNDPTVLFTTAGMHPLVPFLMGEPHPLGNRLASVQKCLRTQDIDEVGDDTHTTCFEMLGNWSLGDYFKKEAITWSWEFLTSKEWLGLDPSRIGITCFAGDKDAPKDNEAANIWRSLGVPESRIAFLGKEHNWWGPAGDQGPCGPDTEMFYWRLNERPAPEKFDPEDENWVEIWNDVFMQYNKTGRGFEPLKQKNVDTGMGVERVTMILQGKENIFETELFQPIIKKISELSGKSPDNNPEHFRIIADHMRAAVFIMGDERAVKPSNLDQGYVLRRFIRRSIRHLKLLGADLNKKLLPEIAGEVIKIYEKDYPLLRQNSALIFEELTKEKEKFLKTLEKGLKILQKESKNINGKLSGKAAFLLFQSYGFPLELTQEIMAEKGMAVDVEGFKKEYENHKSLSRTGAEKRFKGGLSDASEMTTKLHTATHILNEALRRVVDPNIRQRGSNITPERLRFDFNFDRKLTPEEIKEVEDEVNRIINRKLEVIREEMSPEEAKAKGAQAEFGAKYPEKVSVYSIDNYSKEICMGPHVKNTGELGRFRIVKEQSSAAGIRRIKAILE